MHQYSTTNATCTLTHCWQVPTDASYTHTVLQYVSNTLPGAITFSHNSNKRVLRLFKHPHS